MDAKDKWRYIDIIIGQTVECEEKPATLLDRIDEITLNPIVNLAIAFVLLYSILLTFLRFGHIFLTEGVMGKYIFAPGTFYDILIHRAFDGTFLYDIMVGDTAQGYLFSFGLLTTGMYVPFGIVLPAIFIFYVWLTILEDIGYLPRLVMVTDASLKKIGLSGNAIVPTILSLGCNVPGMTGSRILETKKQRFMLSTILAIAVPCSAQLWVASFIIGGTFGPIYLIPIFSILILLYSGIGAVLNRFIEGENPELIMEIPPYRRPMLGNIASKLGVRMKSFFFDAVPWVIIGVLVINLLYISGVLEILEQVIGPALTVWFGIPEEMVGALIIGFLRKDVAVAFLCSIPGLTVWQMITGVVILMIYFPCVATFAVMFKEQGPVNMLKSTALMLFTAFAVGGVLHAFGIIAEVI